MATPGTNTLLREPQAIWHASILLRERRVIWDETCLLREPPVISSRDILRRELLVSSNRSLLLRIFQTMPTGIRPLQDLLAMLVRITRFRELLVLMPGHPPPPHRTGPIGRRNPDSTPTISAWIRRLLTDQRHRVAIPLPRRRLRHTDRNLLDTEARLRTTKATMEAYQGSLRRYPESNPICRTGTSRRSSRTNRSSPRPQDTTPLGCRPHVLPRHALHRRREV